MTEYQIFWDPVTGCDRESPGCKNCFSHGDSLKLKDFGLAKFRNGFETTPHPEVLDDLGYFAKHPALVQICQSSDLFNPRVPDELIKQVINLLWQSPQHQFVMGTKFIARLLGLNLEFPPNVILSVSVEHSDYLWRVQLLRSVKAKQKGLLIAPILSAMPHLPRYLDGLVQVLCYEERSPNPRPFDPAWVGEIGWHCREAGIPFSNLVGQYLVGPYDCHLSGLVFQLIEHIPGVIALPNQFHPNLPKYLALCATLSQFPLADIKEMVRQVAPEFFEG